MTKTTNPPEKFIEQVLNVMDSLACVAEGYGFTDSETAIKINLLICDEVAEKVWKRRKHFEIEDVRWAISRVMRKRLGIKR